VRRISIRFGIAMMILGLAHYYVWLRFVCRSAAQRFADYYVSDRTFEGSLMTTPSGVPRYLLPSTSSALGFGAVGRDRLYGELKHEIKGAVALPNTGVPEARAAGTIRPQVQAALGL
jgi:hypothetical protein